MNVSLELSISSRVCICALPLPLYGEADLSHPGRQRVVACEQIRSCNFELVFTETLSGNFQCTRSLYMKPQFLVSGESVKCCCSYFKVVWNVGGKRCSNISVWADPVSSEMIWWFSNKIDIYLIRADVLWQRSFLESLPSMSLWSPSHFLHTFATQADMCSFHNTKISLGRICLAQVQTLLQSLGVLSSQSR